MNREQIELGLILLAITGSHAYGTNIEGSDIDLKGITIPPIEYFFSTKTFQQKDRWDAAETGRIPELDKHKDIVVYSLSKFMELVSSQNPNILDLLWLPSSCILRKTSVYDELVVYREYFLSKKAYSSFSGYAHAQITKMEKHRTWLLAEAEGTVMQKPEIHDYLPADQVHGNLLHKGELHAFYEYLVCLLKDKFQYFDQYPEFITLGNQIDWAGLIKQQGLPDEVLSHTQQLTKCSDNYIQLLSSTQRYMADCKRHDSWVQWKLHRNPERAALELKCGFDGKNAAHCLRLQLMLVEILKEGKVHVRRTNDADYLRAVRTGQVSYEEVMELSNTLKIEGRDALKTTSLPDAVDKDFVDRVLTDILSRRFST